MSEEKPHTMLVTDAEAFRRLGLPEKRGRVAFRHWDAKLPAGWTRKQKRLGDRRYWPDVEAFVRKQGAVK